MNPTAAIGVLTLMGEIYAQLEQALSRAEAAERRVAELEAKQPPDDASRPGQ